MPTRVVLVHGTRMSAQQWHAYPPLLPGCEVVAVDLPGHGSRVGEEFTVAAAFAVLDEACADADPVVLVGHSLGGYLAMAYAADRPGRVDALVVVGATASPRGPGAHLYRGFAYLLPRLGHARTARLANAALSRLAPDVALPATESYAALPAAWSAVLAMPGPEILREVDCPVWLVGGQYDQLRVDARRYAAQAREAHVVTVPRATHLLPMTHPEPVAAVIREAVTVVDVP